MAEQKNSTVANVKVDPVAEEAVVKMVADMFNSVSYMEPDTLYNNIRLACEGGFSKKDRSIRAELANYLLARFSLLSLGLISNKDFRDMVKDAVSMEIALETEDADFVAEARADMAGDIKPVPSKGSFLLDLSSYNDKVYKTLNGKLAGSFERVAAFDEEVAGLAKRLSEDDMSTIGYIVCNFMYLFRAFAQNPTFTSCVKSTFADVQKQLGLQF